jgi:perosamine synthetase
MTNVIAAMGVAQLEQLETFISKKINTEKIYRKEFEKNEKIYFPISEKNVRWNRWIFGILLNQTKNIKERNYVIEKMLKQNIGVRPFWQPIHLQKAYKKFYKYDLKNVNYVYKKGLHLPSSVNLEENNVEFICDILKKI